MYDESIGNAVDLHDPASVNRHSHAQPGWHSSSRDRDMVWCKWRAMWQETRDRSENDLKEETERWESGNDKRRIDASLQLGFAHGELLDEVLHVVDAVAIGAVHLSGPIGNEPWLELGVVSIHIHLLGH